MTMHWPVWVGVLHSVAAGRAAAASRGRLGGVTSVAVLLYLYLLPCPIPDMVWEGAPLGGIPYPVIPLYTSRCQGTPRACCAGRLPLPPSPPSYPCCRRPIRCPPPPQAVPARASTTASSDASAGVGQHVKSCCSAGGGDPTPPPCSCIPRQNQLPESLYTAAPQCLT